MTYSVLFNLSSWNSCYIVWSWLILLNQNQCLKWRGSDKWPYQPLVALFPTKCQNCSRIPHGYGFPGGSAVKNPPANAGDTGSIPGSGRSLGVGNGNLLQYSWLENPMDRGGSWSTVHGVAQSQIWLSYWASIALRYLNENIDGAFLLFTFAQSSQQEFSACQRGSARRDNATLASRFQA